MSWILHADFSARVRMFKPRTDDGHAAPAKESEEVQSFERISLWFQALVRFFACRRIKPHAPPLVRVPVYSFEF